MRELKFILPFDHTSLAHAVHNKVRADLMANFRGYSEYVGEGNWRDLETGKEYPEGHRLYCVFTRKSELVFNGIAMRAAEALSQKSVAICGYDGEWETVDL